jgi:hypothetical protein
MKKLAILAVLSFQAFSQEQPSGTIIGHLVSSDASTPAVGVRVGVRVTGTGPLLSVVQTDETGYYRLDGIPPGRYYVTAGLTDISTYYPGVLEAIDAKTVNVVVRSTVTGVDFALGRFPDILVSGRVVIEGGGSLPLDSAGLIGSAIVGNSVPKPAALMRMIAARSSDGMRSSTTVRADGTFSLPLQPGGTQIAVQTLPMGYYLKSIVAGSLDLLQVPLTVGETPPAEIVVTLTQTPPSTNLALTTVRGRVNGLPADTTARWVIVQSGTSGPAAIGIPSTISEIPIRSDGTFEVRGVPGGTYFISSFPSSAARQTLVVPAEGVNGVELSWAPPRPARAAPSPRSVNVFGVRGRVETIPGAPMPPAVRLTPAVPSQRSKEVVVGSDGAFEFRDVASGRYELHAGRDELAVARSFAVNREIGGITLKSAVELRGRVVMADGSRMPSPAFQIQSEYAGGGAGNAQTLPTVQREFDVRDDGTFTIGVVQGEQRISVLGLPVSLSVESITFGGTDLVANPLSIAEMPNAEILVTLQPTGIVAPTFSFVYEYGHNGLFHANLIDTARGIYTRDMVGDPPRTFSFRLVQAESDQIEAKLDAIGFWNDEKYPRVFTVPNPGPGGCVSTGRQPMFLAVTRGDVSKELTWLDRDNVCRAFNQAGSELRSLMDLIRTTIESRPEYQQLPRPRGMYID